MALYNLNTVVKIEVFNKRLDERYKWFPERSEFFGLLKYKAGFYYAYSFGSCEFAFSMEEADRRFIVVGDEVYKKPCVKIKFVNPDCSLTEEFDTFEQAHARCMEIRALSSNSIWLNT